MPKRKGLAGSSAAPAEDQPALLKRYLAEVYAELPPGLGWGARKRILRELEDHILDCSAETIEQGQEQELALQQALVRCGLPGAIAHGFEVVANLRRVRLTRAGLLATLALCLGLVGLTFLRHPAIVGSGPLALFYLLLGAAILGGYAWVGLPTAQAATPHGALALRRGTTIGVAAGLAGGVVGLGETLALFALWSHSSAASASTTLWLDHRIEEAAFALPLFVWGGGTFVGSFLAARRTGSTFIGLQIGLWSSLIYMLCSLAIGLVSAYVFGGALAQTVWSHDLVCQAKQDIAACEIGDNLGGAANLLLVMPVLGLGIGWLAGKLGSDDAKVRAIPSQEASEPSRAQHSLALFAAWSCALFLVGLIGHIW